MRRWGLVVTFLYAVILIVLLIPAGVALVGDWSTLPQLHQHITGLYGFWVTWPIVAVFILGQFLLLFVAVDTSDRRLKPRTRIGFSIAVSGLFLAILTVAAAFSIASAIRGDHVDEWGWVILIAGFFVPWVLWSVIFYRYSQDTEDIASRAIHWLIRGSVLELLIAVPSHVIVRRRDDCCAPGVTALGIASGIAIMLMSFGPGVLFLFKKRMAKLKSRAATA